MRVLGPIIKNLAWGILLAAVLGGCDKKSYGPPENQNPVDDQVINRTVVTVQERGPLQPVAVYQQILQQDKSKVGSAFDLIYTEVLEPLTSVLLPTEGTIDREFAGSTDFVAYVEAMHSAFAKLAELDRKNPKLKAMYELYEASALKPCRLGQDQCRNLKLIGRDSGYLFVVVDLIKALDLDPATKWTYFTYGLDFSQYNGTEGLVRFALSTSLEYLQGLLKSDSPTKGADIAQFKKVFNQIVISSSPSKGTVVEFFDRLDIWGTDLSQVNPRLIMREALGSILIRNYTYVEGVPTKSFQGFIDRQMAKSDEPGQADKFANSLDRFEKFPRWQRVSTNFAFKESLAKVNPQLLVLLDLAFTHQMLVADVDAILRSLKPSPLDLLAASEVYMQIQFTALALQTQEEMSKQIGLGSDYSTVTKFGENLRKVSVQETNWKRFRDEKMSAVDALVTSYLPKFLEPEAYERKEKIFNRIDQNIKWEVIYPNILPVAYFVGKSHLQDMLTYLWWTMKIDSDLIYEMLFNGRFESWFNFTSTGNDMQISAAAALQSFDYAITTELFQAWGVKPSDFLLEAIDHLTAKALVRVSTSSEQIVRNLLTDYDEAKIDSHDNVRNKFNKVTDWCLGKGQADESMGLLELSQNLHEFLPELTGNLVNRKTPNSPVYWFSVTPVGFEVSSTSVVHFSDVLRTDDLVRGDQIRFMVSTYKNYLNHRLASKPDAEEAKYLAEELEAMKVVDKAIAKIDSTYRYYYGLVYKSVNRYDDCLDKVFKENRSRQKKVMAYEQNYLRRAYRNITAAAANPATLGQINASYARVFPELDNYHSADRIENIDGNFVFYYNKPDFMLRLRDYIKIGATDLSGIKQDAIAPGMTITLPQDPANDNSAFAGGLNYQMFYKNEQFLTLVYRPGMTEDEFLVDGLRAFWGPWEMGEYAYSPMSRVVFARWNESDASARIMPMQRSRIPLMGTLVKLGAIQTYDFEKSGCNYNSTFEELEANCLTTSSLTIDRMLEVQHRVLDYTNMSKEDEEFAHKTKMAGWIDKDSFYDVLVSKVDQRFIGWADPVRFTLSAGALGNQLGWPGRDRTGMADRLSYLDFAHSYYLTIPVYGTPLLTPIKELKQDLGGIYQSYVDREFKPMLELGRLVDKERKAPPFELHYSIYADPAKIPFVTGYSSEPDDIIKEFNKSTAYYFTMPK